jgi:protein-tyrosine phosphatase
MFALPKLEGAPNFRDVADYRLADGRHIRAGRLFRSQGLHALTDSDVAALRALDVRLVCDLRSRRERLEHPSRWPEGTSTRCLEFDVHADIRANNRRLLDIIRDNPDEQSARRMMIETYRSFPATFAASLNQIWTYMLSDTAGESVPALVHCSAGKDRTGFVIAMMLSALAVPRDVIISDYMQIDKSIDRAQLIRTTEAACRAMLGFSPPPEALAVIASVAPEFLNAAFASIESQYDTVDNYLTTACGLSAASRERFITAMTL